MNNLVELCGAKPGCTHEIAFACTCGNPVIYLCKECTLMHLTEPFTHTFISLEQARELISDREYSKGFSEYLYKYNNIKSEIQLYIQDIISFKQTIITLQTEIIQIINQECQTKLDSLNILQQKAETQLQQIKKKMQMNSYGDNLFKIYDQKGMVGILDSYTPKFEINSSSIKAAILSMITISSPALEVSNLLLEKSRYIFIPKDNTKTLIQYDSHLHQTSQHDLSDVMMNSFNYSSTCILPDGNVMIVGVYPRYGDTYRFNPTNKQSTKYSSLKYPRGFVHLYYNDGYLYAFGGHSPDSDKAERMNLKEDTCWEILPCMNIARCVFGSSYKESLLYLFGGYGSESVEYYDFIKNSFHIVKDLIVPKGGSLIAALDNKLYLINHLELQVLNTDFQILQTVKNPFSNSIFTLSDWGVYGKDIIFYNSHSSTKAVCALDTTTLAIKIVSDI